MSRYILALDQGTTSSRAIVFDRHGRPMAVSQKEIIQYYPQPGWVEHDPEEIWTSQIEAARQAIAMAGIDAGQISAIGIANQRETTVVWHRETGKPIHRAIVWQDRRTADRCSDLQDEARAIHDKTGLVVDSYFSATKLEWILNNIEGARVLAKNGELAFGTVDSFLIWRLTGGKRHLTDVTNASRTMLFDIHRMTWSDDLLRLFDVPQSSLPDVVVSSGIAALADKSIFGVEIPIAGIAGDQQAATFGQACYRPGMAKNTYGTGCFLLMNTGNRPRTSTNRLLTTLAASTDREPIYALEGSVFVAGAAIQWLRDELGLIRRASEAEEIAESISDSGGVYVVPAFTGLGAPYWDSYARGGIFGLTRGAGKKQIVRATLESIAFQCLDVLEAMSKDHGEPIQEIRVDGGASANGFLMQLQADLLGISVVRPTCTETTALGAAYLAGLAVGVWSSTDEIEKNWTRDRVFSPTMPDDRRDELIDGWKRAVARVRSDGQ